MASKRKYKPPSKLFKEKRQRLAWNLNDLYKNINNGVDSCSFPMINVEMPSSSDGILCRHQETKNSYPSNERVAEGSIISKMEGDSLCPPWLIVPTECSKCLINRPFPTGICLGPAIFQILLTSEILGRNLNSKFNRSFNGSKCEWFCGKEGFLLKIFEDNRRCDFSSEDRHEAEIHLTTKELSQREIETGNWTWDAQCNKYDLHIWSGYLVLPKAILLSIGKLVHNKQFRLVVNPNDLDKSELFIHARIIENELPVMASDNLHVNKKFHKMHMETIMNYFHEICEEMVYDNSKQKFCFTANEIPALYYHIKKYHSQRFSIAYSEDGMVYVDDYGDDAILNDCHENSSNVSSLDQAISSDSFSKSPSIKFDNEDDYLNELEDVKSELDVIGENVEELSVSNHSIIGIKVDLLIPKLRKYQHAAVQWMISKENETEYELGIM